MNLPLKLYGLIGYPLSHSFSKRYFAEKFTKEHISDCFYDLYPIEQIELLPQLLKSYSNLCGLNVTIPYKELVLPYLQHISQPVQEIGACNCIAIKNGVMYGYNTDVIGFEKMLLPYLRSHHTRALILGTGGAAKAVGWVLEKNHITYNFVSRSQSDMSLPYSKINHQNIKENTLIINTTPLGMSPDVNSFPPIPYELISDLHLCVDLIYNPSKTKFMELAERNGATIVNGMDMLVIQAEESWKIWSTMT